MSRQDNDIAIVGMSCLFPEAPNLGAFWKNIVRGIDCLRDASELEWDTTRYYDPNSSTFSKAYCKKGGFVSELADFDPIKFGVMPNAVAGIDPDQLLALRVASEALADAGYQRQTFNGERAEVIIGRTSAPGGGSMNMIQHGTTVQQMVDVVAKLHPDLTHEELETLAQSLDKSLRTCNSDTITGVMPNILAGRIAGRLGFKGRSMILDSACASSLIAVEIAVRDLQSGMCDLALAGGVHINSFPVFYQMFSGLGALSHRQSIRPFDNEADGTLLGEGVGMVVLKRLADAVRDTDRIYAVIKGIGSSSDGQGTSMLAPSFEGESLAMQRAYEMAGVSPHSVQLLEAHGTGTPTGDVAELTAVQNVFQADATHRQWCAIGSVKSNIGHAQAASGMAGLIKVALSLHQKVLPATLNVQVPNKQIDWPQSPCYINGRSYVWVHPQVHASVRAGAVKALGSDHSPRRAAVSAFGFGGVNAHAVLEEFPDKDEAERANHLDEWLDEVCLFAAESNEELAALILRVLGYLEQNPKQAIKNIAFTLSLMAKETSRSRPAKKVAIVARSVMDLQDKLQSALTSLGEDSNALDFDANSQTISGIYWLAPSNARQGKLAFVLPGLGAAYPHMLADLSVHFPDVRAVFDFVDALAIDSGASELPSEKVFPIPGRNGKHGGSSTSELAAMDSAVVIVMMAEWALYTVLEKLGIKADSLLGVSTGEFAALNISGAADIVTSAQTFYKYSTTVARSVPQDHLSDLRTLKIDADANVIDSLLKKLPAPVYLGASLTRTQCLVSGDKEAIVQAQQLLKAEKIEFQQLPIAIPYHTPLVDGHIDPDSEGVKALPLHAPKMEAWSCSLADTYPTDIEALRKLSTNLFTRPIRLLETIEKMYARGITSFIEVGPKGSLTPIIDEILQGKPHLAVAANLSVGSALSQLNHLIAVLFCHDVSFDLNYLFQRRSPEKLDFDQLPQSLSKTSVKLNLRFPEISLDENAAADLRKSLKREHQAQASSSHVPGTAGVPPASAGPGLDVAAKMPAVPWAAHINQQGDYIHDGFMQNQDFSPPQDASQQMFAHYFSNLTMLQQNMMQMQQQMMQAFMQSDSQGEIGCHPPVGPYDLINTGLQAVTGDNNSVQLDMVLTLQDHQYLTDHAIGGTVSTDYGIERVFLLPLTVALELMAEAGALLVADKVVASFEHIRAMRRIRVGAAGCRITVSAARYEDDPDLIKAMIHVHLDAPGDEPLDEAPAMSCQIRFQAGYAPKSAKINLNSLVEDSRPPQIEPANLYMPETMFHGPRMQSVLSITRVGKKQILGRVAGRDAQAWLSDRHSANFITNPLLLDNATQLVLFHLFEHGQQANALLPFLVESLEIFADLNQFRGEANVFAQLTAVTQRGTEANVQLITDDGQVLAQFDTICSRRIVLDSPWHQFVYQPKALTFAKEVHELRETLPSPQFWSSIMMRADQLPEDDVTLLWCLDYALHPGEIRYCERFFKNTPRRREWVLGRIAAKEAVKSLVARLAGIELCPADIAIVTDDNGRPWVQGEFINALGWAPLISITHKSDQVLAIAAHPQVGLNVGVDMEEPQPRDEDFAVLALTDSEKSMSSLAPPEKRDEMIALLWAAKEAAAKASGLGLRNNPKSIEIRNATYNSEQVQATLLWISGTAFDTTMNVYIRRLDNCIVAIAALQPAAAMVGQ
jgi:acyl transferase domain-containing protein/phosphopantetheinyl transferase (holo-ACP synthase)